MKRFLFFITVFLVTTLSVVAQNTIKGRVVDTENEPLPGVSVSIKGTNKGAITDIKGAYTLSDVSKTDTLTFTFIGMLAEELPVGDQTEINLTLVPDFQDLEEVVVVGYGEQKRANLTGSVADINADKIEDIPSGNLSTALQGKMAGIKIGQVTGKPGASTSIQIRTTSSFSVVEAPLYVIDGVIYEDQTQFDLLDPSEIESISILKDASAAVYGSRAAAGVILVKTKKGKIGKPKITYSGSFGISRATSFPEMLSAYEHASMLNYLYENDSVYRSEHTRYDTYTEDELDTFKTMDYNWLDNLWNKNAYVNRHTLNIQGGSENVKYFIGGSYYYQTGNLDNVYDKKYSFRSNIDAEIIDNLTANLSVSIGNTNSEDPFYYKESSTETLREVYKRLLTAPRWVPPVIDGKLVSNNMTDWQPYGVMQSGSYRSSYGNYSTISGALNYKIPKINGLSLNVQYSYSIKNGMGKKYSQDYSVYQFKGTGSHRHILTNEVYSSQEYTNKEQLEESSDKSTSYQLNTSINYSRSFGMHDINAVLVYEQAESEGNNFNITRYNSAVSGIDQMWAFNEANQISGSGATESGRLSYIGRLNYKYSSKYILEGTFRYEASQKFHPDNAWGFFPALSAGWIVSEENFFKNNISFVNFLKFRASAGRVGNDNIGTFQWKYLFSGNQTGALFGTSLTNALDPKNDGLSSPSITWQKSNYYNTGFDTKIFQNKIDFGVDYYYRFTYDILAERNSSLSSTAGIKNRPAENYGEMYATGFELQVGYNGQVGADFKYTVDGNFSWDKHMKTVVDQSPAAIGRWDDQTKNDPGNQPGLTCLGMIRNEEDLAKVREMYDSIGNEAVALGMLYYADIRGENYSEGPDGKINEYDRSTIAKYTSPPYNCGLSLGASWKGLSIDMTFTGEFGHKVFINKDEMVLPDENNNVFSFWNDYWTPENPNASMPRPYRYGQEEQISTFWMRNGTTLRLRTINVSYTLPSTFSNKLNISQTRVYFTTTNLWTIISPFDFKDPDVAKAYDYPMQRTFNVGVSITL